MKKGSDRFSMCMILPRSSTICRSGTTLTPSISAMRAAPAEILVEPHFGKQALDPGKPDKATILDIGPRKTDAAKRFRQLYCPGLRRPFEAESRESAGEFGKARPIGTLIRAWTRLDLQCSTRDGVNGSLRDGANLVIEMIRAVVERLVVDELDRTGQEQLKSANEIVDVDNRAPGLAVA